MAAPTPNRLPFRIRPATEKDCPDLAKVEITSFNDVKNEPAQNAILKIMLGPPSEKLIAYRTKNFVERLQTIPATRFWKAVVDDENEPSGEKVVACALWKFFTKPDKVPDWKNITEWPLSIPPDACNELVAELLLMRKRYMDEKCYGFLEVLGTLPEYRGHGIASALMKVGLEEAKKEGLKEFWINASIDAKALYEKYGFREVDAVRLDISKYGGIGKSNMMGMRMAFDS